VNYYLDNRIVFSKNKAYVKSSRWGKYPLIETQRYIPSSISDLRRYGQAGFIRKAYAAQRSHGDSALAKQMIATTALDHVLKFDSKKEVPKCEPGINFAGLLQAVS
jgi:hypothetical protein